MNNSILLYISRFVALVLAQVILFNHINFLGYINPYIYIIYIALAPLNTHKSLFLFVSFLLGLSIDMFGDSGGVHAAACVSTAFSRPIILRSVFGLSYEFQTMKLSRVGLVPLFTYVAALVSIHHIILFSLEYFNIAHILQIAKKTLFSGILSSVVITIILIFFRKKDS
ncbi:rod shape-determining protein MreD [Aquimarina sp. ERC-38]|uniref:rod shape-determining protein MreD n=1 Tax=Aquimarina sp. ERC-38 TaxID=2949996 RepID=UPI0022460151|nr:rod shape-determining protein MreD [Aquimarina sp. ERC-38]UZO81276.1 rod shape-determining protein MreD [Aquimarina sp. ERC-38]